MSTCTSFSGHDCIASGSLQTVALAVKRAVEKGADSILTFDDTTGRLILIDTRGSDEEIIARLGEPTADALISQPIPEAADTESESRGRGRPKLGVVAREVTLLPRHWEWLATQPGGASVALRKLVEEARKASSGKDRTRQAQERAYRFMSAMAGNLTNFEDASRALFANDQARFSDLITVWPDDVRDYATRLAFGDSTAPHEN